LDRGGKIEGSNQRSIGVNQSNVIPKFTVL